MKLVGAALADHDDLVGLVELRRSPGGDDLELSDRVERRHFSFSALQGDLHVGDPIERESNIAVGIALIGAECQGNAADGHLILRCHVLHSRDQVQQPEDAEVSIQWCVLNRRAIDHQADGGILSLNDRAYVGDIHRLLLRAYVQPGVDLRHLVNRQGDVFLLKGFEAGLVDPARYRSPGQAA